jgi:D-sedoheptulose 7-phosphate isomerase|tara:strand:- start:887 stop:1450 length:564 start_codon:yes stop_codon:yes gene_type:complete
MNEKTFLLDYFQECSDFLLDTTVTETVIAAKKMILNSKLSGNKLIFAGNGASASIANHASLDFTKQGGVKSVNFNESAFITAFANDYGYERWLEKALEFYGEKGDTLILISCSGTSPNVVNAAKYANASGINVITFTGHTSNNPLKIAGDINFWIDSKAYNIIEGVHQIWLLSICDLIIGKKEYSVT